MPHAVRTPLGSGSSPERFALQVHEAVRTVLGELRERAPAAERLAKVPQQNIEALRPTGIFDLMRPAAFGGAEGWFEHLFPIIVEIGKACASTAWCVGQAAVNQWMLSCAAEQAQHDVWNVDPQALICASYAPAALAEGTSEGWRLDGKFAWASGCDNARWVFLGAILRPAHGIETPTPALLLVPMTDCKILDDWDVVGLAATGSKTLMMERVVVPAHRIVLMPDSLAGTTPSARANAKARQGLPMLTVLPPILAAAGIGAALGALADSIDATRSRTASGGVMRGPKVAEFPAIQMRIAEAAATIDAAQAILMRDLEEVAREVRGGATVSVQRRILCRRNHGFATRLTMKATDLLFEALGAGGLHKKHPVQRAWRDVHAVASHINLNWDMTGQMYAQAVLGLEPKGLY